MRIRPFLFLFLLIISVQSAVFAQTDSIPEDDDTDHFLLTEKEWIKRDAEKKIHDLELKMDSLKALALKTGQIEKFQIPVDNIESKKGELLASLKEEVMPEKMATWKLKVKGLIEDINQLYILLIEQMSQQQSLKNKPQKKKAQ